MKMGMKREPMSASSVSSANASSVALSSVAVGPAAASVAMPLAALLAGLAATATVVGGLSALMGIGGGAMHVPFLSYCGVPVKRAIATAAAIVVGLRAANFDRDASVPSERDAPGSRLLRRVGGAALILVGIQVCLGIAALVAVTPLFVRNATLAYTDIPTTFPLTLAVLYVLRWWDSGRARDAALAGVLIGIALFTKQSALTWLASLALVPPLWLSGVDLARANGLLSKQNGDRFAFV